MVAKVQKTKSRSRKWTLHLTVEAPEKNNSTLPSHPLNSVTKRGREESRLQTLGEVLAAIAGRRNGMGENNSRDRQNLA